MDRMTIVGTDGEERYIIDGLEVIKDVRTPCTFRFDGLAVCPLCGEPHEAVSNTGE